MSRLPHPFARRILIAVLVVSTIGGVVASRLIWEWYTALANVNAMLVEERVLPTIPPEPTAIGLVATAPPALAAGAPTPTVTPRPEHADAINILLLGTDARPGERISRTDAIILVHLNPRMNRVSMLSVPRDLTVDVPGFGSNKVNAAYAIGEQQLGAGYGPSLAKATVSQLVGVPVHNVVVVNFDGFQHIVDTLGGISIDVPQPIDDPYFPVDEYAGDVRTMPVKFSSGPQVMDGRTALMYARTRHADNDFGRNQRQQQVLMAIFDAIRAKGLLSQLTSIDDYTAALRDAIRTDLSHSQLLWLAQVGSQLDAGAIQRYAINSRMIIVLDEYENFAADPAAVRQIIDEMTAGGTEAP